MKNPVGRPRTIFKPYKDIKRKKSGTIHFYMDNELTGSTFYHSPSHRLTYINLFKRRAINKTFHRFHYEIIPNIEP